MLFNFKGLARFIYKSLFKSRGTHYRLTPKRIGWLVLFFIVYPALELVTWLGFLLDNIFFPAYREVEIEEPVFIIGNPRSGTTFLQRLLAKDRRNFTSMKMWEILLAPSITQRKIIWGLMALDHQLGGPLDRLMTAWERQWSRQNELHKVALGAPEEDQYLLLHIWSTLAVWLFSAILEDEAKRYVYFDTAMTPAEKRRIMKFYKRCVQRHLYAHADSRERTTYYLSKNPSASPKVDTLYDFFPDAKIVYLVRSPLHMIPSYISLMDYTWRIFGDPLEAYASREYVLDASRYWYSYPLERLELAPKDSYVVVNFEDLVSNARRTVTHMYDRLDLEITSDFDQVLQEETEKARNYQSSHEYSFAEIGLKHEQIVKEYREVFDRFGFDTEEKATEDI